MWCQHIRHAISHEKPPRARHDNPPRGDMKSTFSQPAQIFPRIIIFLAQIQLKQRAQLLQITKPVAFCRIP